MIVIADASPINYLVLIGEIDVLYHLYERVLIPVAVFKELSRAAAPAAVRQWMNNPPSWLEVRHAGVIPDFSIPLDAGESEAIAIAEELQANLVIVDEAAARTEAERLGFRVIGTLGVLREASALGLVDLHDAVSRLKRTNFRISVAFLENFLRKHT